MAIMSLDFPVVDIAPFLTGSPAERHQVAAHVRRAFEDNGCLIITGHGIDPAILERVDRLWRGWFAAPVEQKQACASHPGLFRGYIDNSAIGRTYSDGAEHPPDLREVYFMNRPDPLPAAYLEQFGPLSAYLGAANLWPADAPDLRESLETCYRAMDRLARQLLEIFAVAMDLPHDYFADKVNHHTSTLGVAHYPDQQNPPRPRQLRCGEHRDFGTLTILHRDDAPGGLQVFRQGEWVDVPAVPGSLVVNLGDTTEEWTNRHWKSTLHRVVNPPPELAARSRRQSILFFQQPNFETVLECFPCFVDPAAPPRGKPPTVGEFILAKAQQTAG